jgi:phage N-6-adenine-methyltransferase
MTVRIPRPRSEHREHLKEGIHSSVHFLSRKPDWSTPQWIFDILDAEFGFTLDACATAANAKCAHFFTPTEDGLAQDWGKHRVFMNPPYGRTIAHWMQKAYSSAQQGATVVCLIPARTDTTWWHQFAMKGEVRLIRGRIRFEGAKHGAPFPSAVVVFRPASFGPE